MERDIYPFRNRSKDDDKEIKVFSKLYHLLLKECIKLFELTKSYRFEVDYSKIVEFLSRLSVFKRKILDYVTPKPFIREIL
jgi:hypothetical protein